MTKTERIGKQITDNIDSGRWREGMRLPPEHELASTFGVTRVTLRRAIEPLKRCGHLAGSRGRGTYVTAGRRRAVSMLYAGETQSHFYQNLFHAIAAEGQDEGRMVLPFSVEAGTPWERPLRERLAAHLANVKWAVVCSSSYGPMEDALRAADVHLIVIGSDPVAVCRPAYFVLADRGRAVEVAVAHLVGLGHRRIGLVTPGNPPPGGGSGPYTPELHKPYHPCFHAAIARHGLQETASCVFLPQDHQDDPEPIRQCLRSPDRPTALVCDADFRARIVYTVAREEGLRVPEDLSVVGIGDTPWCQAFMPEMTSVNLGEADMAHLVVMLSRDGPPSANTICRVEPHLVERTSCRALR